MKVEVGQTVWVRKTGNAVYHLRGRTDTTPEDYIEEAKVASVGRKWFTLGGNWSSYRFNLETGGNDGCGYGSSCFVHLTKQEILDAFERAEEMKKLWVYTSSSGGTAIAILTLDQLRRINAIIEETR